MPAICVPSHPNLPGHSSSPPPRKPFLSKRLIVCCDGTWQDGIVMKKRWQYSNIIKLSRMLNHQDDRKDPPAPQIVFYQGGVGSEQNFYSENIEGATGGSLAEKVQEAYAFLAHNYQPGDDVYLFGFSRGAYTARMVASFIGEIGILDKKDMDSFADIFVAFQKRGSATDEQEIQQCNKTLEPFMQRDATGRRRADPDGDTFTISCLGVFDTVGSLGLPEELSFSPKIKRLFGFPNKYLGPHVHRAYHAMALNKTRADFNVSKFETTEKGRKKGQILEQVWFAGSHSDVGGGWHGHDLADISLAWMASKIEGLLSLDYRYLRSIPNPVAAWGKLLPHDPQTGIFRLSQTIQRTLPTRTDDVTCETVHPSVMFQRIKLPQLEENVKQNPSLVCSLGPLEDSVRDEWPYVPGQHALDDPSVQSELESHESEKKTLRQKAQKALGLKTETMEDEGGKPRYDESWLGAVLHELQ